MPRTRLITGLVGLLGLLVASHPAEPILEDANVTEPRFETQNFRFLQPRDDADPTGRPLCGLELLLSRRYTPIGQLQTQLPRWLYDEDDGNTTAASPLFKRQMTLPASDSDADMRKFLIQEGAKKQNRLLAWQHESDEISRDVNNAVIDAIPKPDPNNRQVVAFGQHLDHLAGCTGLMIVSRKGIYGGHYWENVGFDLDKKIHGDLYKDSQEAFQKSIIDALKNGVYADGDKIIHDSLTDFAKLIGDEDSVKAFLMIPDKGPSKPGKEGKKDPYRKQWDEMKKTIGEIIPKLKDPLDSKRWQEVPYSPVEDEDRRFKRDANGKLVLDENKEPICTYDPLDDTVKGRMLCKFDNKHGPRGEKKNKLTLWIEGKQWHDDTW